MYTEEAGNAVDVPPAAPEDPTDEEGAETEEDEPPPQAAQKGPTDEEGSETEDEEPPVEKMGRLISISPPQDNTPTEEEEGGCRGYSEEDSDAEIESQFTCKVTRRAVVRLASSSVGESSPG